MPVEIDIFDFKCFNQLRNGELFEQNLSEFTPNLVGNTGEKVKLEFKANLSQYAAAENAAEWTFIDLPGNAIVEVFRTSGSFLEDAVQVGDTLVFYRDWVNRKLATNGVYQGVVDFISGDGQTMRHTVLNFLPGSNISDFPQGTLSNVGFVFDQLSPENINTAFFLKFGLIGNDETFNYNSKTTDALQVWYRGSLSPSGVPSLVPAESLGIIKDWVSGVVEIGLSDIDPDFGSAQYTITHELILNPFYILSFRADIKEGTVPALLAGDDSIKYAAELEFRKTLSDTGSSKLQPFDSLGGFVGWYGENFNGLNSKYGVASVAYEAVATGDPLASVNINTPTRVTITVEKFAGAITGYSCSVHLFRVPVSEEEYVGTSTDLVTNFLFKSSIVSSPATSAANISTSLVAGNLVIEYIVDYVVDEKLRLTTEDEFLLLVQIEDPTIAVGNSDRIMLIADFKNYTDVDFIAGFIDVSSYQFISHAETLGVDSGESSKITSNEDGIILDALIGTNTSKDVIINSVKVNLLAHDPTLNKSFNLDEYIFNIGDLVVVGGVQQIEIDSLRGYPLPVGDSFNVAKIITEGPVGNLQQYRIQLGQKIKWQDWIFNPEVDSVFFDSAKPNNNLNERASNYSDEQNFQIRVALTINVTGVDDLGRVITGDFVEYGGVLAVNDYDESEDGVTGEIQTFDLDSGSSLEGGILFNGKDTLFRTVFQNAANMAFAIHRIELSQSQGDGILEFSSLLPSTTGNLLKPLTGESLLRFDLVGSELITECLIDGSLIQEGAAYKLSARVVGSQPLELVIQTEHDNAIEDDLLLELTGITPVWLLPDASQVMADILETDNPTFDGTVKDIIVQILNTSSLANSVDFSEKASLINTLDLSIVTVADGGTIEIGGNGLTSLIPPVFNDVLFFTINNIIDNPINVPPLANTGVGTVKELVLFGINSGSTVDLRNLNFEGIIITGATASGSAPNALIQSAGIVKLPDTNPFDFTSIQIRGNRDTAPLDFTDWTGVLLGQFFILNSLTSGLTLPTRGFMVGCDDFEVSRVSQTGGTTIFPDNNDGVALCPRTKFDRNVGLNIDLTDWRFGGFFQIFTFGGTQNGTFTFPALNSEDFTRFEIGKIQNGSLDLSAWTGNYTGTFKLAQNNFSSFNPPPNIEGVTTFDIGLDLNNYLNSFSFGTQVRALNIILRQNVLGLGGTPRGNGIVADILGNIGNMQVGNRVLDLLESTANGNNTGNPNLSGQGVADASTLVSVHGYTITYWDGAINITLS